jgi:hypothetical protein
MRPVNFDLTSTIAEKLKSIASPNGHLNWQFDLGFRDGSGTSQGGALIR